MLSRPFLALAIAISFAVSSVPTLAQIAAPPEPMEVSKSEVPADFIFHKRVDEVNLLFTVVDGNGKFISNLQLEDFALLDDRRPPEKIHAFQQESDLPLRVALVVDISGSVTSRFKYEQQASVAFFKKILRPEVDQAAVIGFNQKTSLMQGLTNDVKSLKSAVYRLKPDGETALFDALVYASDLLRKNSEKGTRKAIILISDGENNQSHAIMNDAQQAALRAETPIYTLSTNRLDRGQYTKGEATLELLSQYTGGELIPVKEDTGVVSAFRKVEQALRSQYVLSYKPAEFSGDGRYRAVALTTRKTSLKVECRHGYYAPKDQP
jgi:Ca-activated chloride channel family protein